MSYLQRFAPHRVSPKPGLKMRHIAKSAKSFKENSQIVESLRDHDGLIPSTELIIDRTSQFSGMRLRRFPKVQVFSHIQLSHVVELLVQDESLWKGSALDVAVMPSIIGRMTIFGVPLGRAFNQAIKRGLSKSRFILQDNNYDHQRGFPADLLLFVGLDSKSQSDIREIQVWEDVRGSSEVFYAHAILSVASYSVQHLDAATIHFNDQQKADLFNRGQKLKGESYRKHFRVDGQFPLTTAIELMQAYFPIDELTSEAFDLCM